MMPAKCCRVLYALMLIYNDEGVASESNAHTVVAYCLISIKSKIASVKGSRTQFLTSLSRTRSAILNLRSDPSTADDVSC